MVCLCSSDRSMPNRLTLAVQAFHAAGASHIYLAGQPNELEPALRQAGAFDFIFAGTNALAALNDVWQRLERSWPRR